MCNNDAVPYSGIWPAILSLRTEKKIAGHRIFVYHLFQAVNAGGDANEYGADLADGRVPQLASIPKTKRQAALQPTHNGSDEVSNERKSRQRVDSRFHNCGGVRVHRVKILTLRADFKRLVTYSKKAVKVFGVKPEGMPQWKT